MVGASRGLSEAMAGVSSSRAGPPSFGPEDAVSVVEATCSPHRGPLQVGSPAFVLLPGAGERRHNAHQDHWGARFDTRSWRLRHCFQPDLVCRTVRRVCPRRCKASSQRKGLSFEQRSPTNSPEPSVVVASCSARKAAAGSRVCSPADPYMDRSGTS